MTERNALFTISDRDLIERLVRSRQCCCLPGSPDNRIVLEGWLEHIREMSPEEKKSYGVEKALKEWSIPLSIIEQEIIADLNQYEFGSLDSRYLNNLLQKFVDRKEADWEDYAIVVDIVLGGLYDHGFLEETLLVVRNMCRNGGELYFGCNRTVLSIGGLGMEIPDSTHAERGEVLRTLTLKGVLELILETWLENGPLSRAAGNFLFSYLEREAAYRRAKAVEEYRSAVAVSEDGVKIVTADVVVVIREDGSSHVVEDTRPFKRHKILRVNNLVRNFTGLDEWPNSWSCELDQQKFLMVEGKKVFVTPESFVPDEILNLL